MPSIHQLISDAQVACLAAEQEIAKMHGRDSKDYEVKGEAVIALQAARMALNTLRHTHSQFG